MTPLQLYFPYFFDLKKFNKALSLFGLISHVTSNENTKMPENLIIAKKKIFSFSKSEDVLLRIPFGTTLMIQEDKLNCWKTTDETIDITQVILPHLVDRSISTSKKINLLNFPLGYSKIETGIVLKDFVTYVRKEGLRYNQNISRNS